MTALTAAPPCEAELEWRPVLADVNLTLRTGGRLPFGPLAMPRDATKIWMHGWQLRNVNNDAARGDCCLRTLHEREVNICRTCHKQELSVQARKSAVDTCRRLLPFCESRMQQG